MNNNEMIQRKINTGNLVHINGKILRTLNVISESKCQLSSLEYSFGDIEHDSFVNSVKYLNMSGYVELKDCWTKKRFPLKNVSLMILKYLLQQKEYVYFVEF